MRVILDAAGPAWPGKHIVTVSEDGALVLWDPKQATPVFRLSASASQSLRTAGTRGPRLTRGHAGTRAVHWALVTQMKTGGSIKADC